MEAPQNLTKKMSLIGQEKFNITEVNIKPISEIYITKEKNSKLTSYRYCCAEMYKNSLYTFLLAEPSILTSF